MYQGLKLSPHPCGTIAVARVTKVPALGDSSLEPERVVEFSPEGMDNIITVAENEISSPPLLSNIKTLSAARLACCHLKGSAPEKLLICRARRQA
ncbi:MAG: hypothetical protein AAF152_09845 [Cyanobacteria bacterium P01_A01_bin.114]